VSLGVEIMDMRELEVGARHCKVEFVVWCPRSRDAVSIECLYSLDSGDLLPCLNPDHPMYGNVPEKTISDVLRSDTCKADARELILATRDLNREKN
jgi:hypothetical protein